MESETKGALIKVFVQKMKTRDMRVPAKDDFNPEDLPTDMVALCQQMEAEGLPIEFWYDTSVLSNANSRSFSTILVGRENARRYYKAFSMDRWLKQALNPRTLK